MTSSISKGVLQLIFSNGQMSRQAKGDYFTIANFLTMDTEQVCHLDVS